MDILEWRGDDGLSFFKNCKYINKLNFCYFFSLIVYKDKLNLYMLIVWYYFIILCCILIIIYSLLFLVIFF